MMTLPPHMGDKLRELVTMLVQGDYEGVVERGMSGAHDAEGLRDSIEYYPGQISMPPPHAFEEIRQWIELEWDLDVEEARLTAEAERTWMLVFTLWFDGEESDLTLEAHYHEPFVGEAFIDVEMIKS